MRPKSRNISLVVIFAALYAILTIVFAPISFYIWQVRVADALLPLSIIFGVPCAIGLGLGCFIGNMYGWLTLSGLGLIDVICGPLANFMACIIAYWIGSSGNTLMRFLGTIIETAIITFVVGGYLSILFNVPPELGMLGILIGSLISINMLGFALEEIMRRIYSL